MELAKSLPMLPLNSGVVLPGMVLTLALETDEAKAALEAAGIGREPPGPRARASTAAMPRSGWWPRSSSRASCPGGPEAVVVSGEARVRLGIAMPGTGEALWVQIEPVDDDAETEDTAELAREYRAVLENILLIRGARAMAERLRQLSDASQIADLAGYSPDLSLEQKVAVLEAVDLDARLELVLEWARETLADLTLRKQIQADVEEGMEKTQREFLLRRQLEAIRKELGELEGSDGPGADGSPEGYRRRLEERRASRGGSRRARARDRQARAHQRAEPRARVDPYVDRHGARVAVGRHLSRQSRRRGGRRRPRRGPRRAGGREEADPRAPGRAQAARRARAQRRRLPRRGGHPGPGRPARGG